ncbi:unnamed protein product, partial [Mycena citricolor]
EVVIHRRYIELMVGPRPCPKPSPVARSTRSLPSGELRPVSSLLPQLEALGEGAFGRRNRAPVLPLLPAAFPGFIQRSVHLENPTGFRAE